MHTDEDRARFLTFLPDSEEQLAQLEADGEITTAREIAFVVPAPEMVAQGMPPFAVLPVRMVRELCTKTASPMTRRLAALAALVTALCACAPTPSGGTYQLARPVTDRGVTLGAGTLTFGAERVDMALTVSITSCSEPAMVTASA